MSITIIWSTPDIENLNENKISGVPRINMNVEDKENIWSTPDFRTSMDGKNIWCTPDKNEC